jgi:hypothetical protein
VRRRPQATRAAGQERLRRLISGAARRAGYQAAMLRRASAH